MRKHLFITGAGVSADSGIPTFRGKDGFWTIGSINFTPQEMATRQMYIEKPAEFLHWYFKRFAEYRNTQPNMVHEWLSKKKLITQNIDGLHHRSGVKDERIIEVHGNATKAKCLDCEKELSLKLFHDAISNNEEIPNCPSCFGLVKVATISFGQPMNMNDFEKSKDKIFESDLLIVLGSSLQVQPTASLPAFAVQNEKKLIIINNDPTNLDQYADVCIHEDICKTVARINI